MQRQFQRMDGYIARFSTNRSSILYRFFISLEGRYALQFGTASAQ